MKTLEELETIRQRTLEKITLRKEDKEEAFRVVVGMATCGIAAGAKPVLMAFLDEIARRNLRNITVVQTGCIGMCRFEPMADVIAPDGRRITYVSLTPEKVRVIVADHLANGHPVAEFSIGATQATEA